MHSRLEHPEPGVPFSDELSGEISEILNFVYDKKLTATNSKFSTFGYFYKTEVVLIISVSKNDAKDTDPHKTFIASCEHKEDERTKKYLEALTDGAGFFLEQVLNNSDWNDFSINWTKEEIKGMEVQYITTRENVKLTIIANKLLEE